MGNNLDLQLPPIETFPLLGCSTNYGAGWLAARYCGFPDVPAIPRGYWQHGSAFQHAQLHPYCVMARNTVDRWNECYWVARRDEEQFLRRHGYPRVKAIGLPIAYVPEVTIPRRPRSLLVMPAHSTTWTTHSCRFEEYAEAIDRIRPQFSEVVVCIHPSCWDKGYWVKDFQKRDYPLVRGVSSMIEMP